MYDYKELKPHKLNVFPDMDADTYKELKDSISKSGFDDNMPLTYFKCEDGEDQGGIIDGANRLRACQELGIRPTIKTFYGTIQDATKYILKTNIRRNLNAGQKAAIVLDMDSIVNALVSAAAASRNSHLEQYTERPPVAERGNTANALAEIAGVGKETVKQAKKVKEVDPQLYEHVKDGTISAKSAYNQINNRIDAHDSEQILQRAAKSLAQGWIKEAIKLSNDAIYAHALEVAELSISHPELDRPTYVYKITLECENEDLGLDMMEDHFTNE